MREGSQDKWDLLIAGSWVNKDKVYALKYIASRIQKLLNKDELLKITGIAIIDESNPALKAIFKAVHVEHGRFEIKNSIFFGLNIKHAFLITSSKKGIKPQADSFQRT